MFGWRNWGRAQPTSEFREILQLRITNTTIIIIIIIIINLSFFTHYLINTWNSYIGSAYHTHTHARARAHTLLIYFLSIYPPLHT